MRVQGESYGCEVASPSSPHSPHPSALNSPPVVTRGPEVRWRGPGLFPSWSPRDSTGKRRGEAEAAFQLGGWRRPGRAPRALRPPELGPRPPSGSHRGTARTFPQPGGPWKHLNLSPTHDHQVSTLHSVPDSSLQTWMSLGSTRQLAFPGRTARAPGLGGPSHHTSLPPPQRPPVAPQAHSFCSLQHPGLTGH